MRLSELATKKIINLYDGAIVGSVGDADLTIDPDTGQIVSLLLPQGRSRSNREQLSIDWESIRKVGAEVILIELDGNALM